MGQALKLWFSGSLKMFILLAKAEIMKMGLEDCIVFEKDTETLRGNFLEVESNLWLEEHLDSLWKEKYVRDIFGNTELTGVFA